MSEKEYRVIFASRWLAFFARQKVGHEALTRVLVEEFPEFTPDEAFRALKGAISILEDLERRHVETAVDDAARRLADLALQRVGEKALKEFALREFSHFTPDEMPRAFELGTGLAKEAVADWFQQALEEHPTTGRPN